MNYFIFYNKSCVAYTDSKKMMKAFIKPFKNKEAFSVDKFKVVDKFFLDDQQIEDLTLYYHDEAKMFLNEFLDLELHEYSQSLIDDMLGVINRIDNASEMLRIDDNERYLIDQFLLNHGVVIEDVEWLFYENIDIPDVLEQHVFLSLNEQFNRKE